MFRSGAIAGTLARALVVLALALRVLVPVGYMPASVSDGFYLQWCPAGVAPQVLDALFAGDAAMSAAGADGADGAAHASPHQHHHHHHHAVHGSVDRPAHGGHGAMAHGGARGDRDDDSAPYVQCELSGFSADAHAAPSAPVFHSPDVIAVPYVLWRSPTPRRAPRVAYRSRAPPTPA